MYYDRDFGVVVLEKSWVPAPRYLMRRARLLSWMKAEKPGRILEIGPGSGALLKDFARAGWECVGLDTSSDALALADYIRDRDQRIELCSDQRRLAGQTFDYVIACEVLEHIEDDSSAFEEWASFLKPRGGLILSVPAHQKRWDATDEWAGHFRRYENEDLVRIAGENGMLVEKLECYGFPLALITTALRARRISNDSRQGPLHESMDSKTAHSGISRSFESRYFGLQQSLPGRISIKVFIFLQRLFLKTQLGNGYIMLARKP
ncbi:class I SAM-dependent methyltransferase [Puniceicoccus vermicola]|uniref:Class I SAM-dependent methyltransferase n=1 Tax=Puniceicoccus vermicola TaxID=388746 RepID=A0A7X1E5W5_9BACT|nr:class I SAM-dependent methyltransferase [Puniceicoccus vermicola]